MWARVRCVPQGKVVLPRTKHANQDLESPRLDKSGEKRTRLQNITRSAMIRGVIIVNNHGKPRLVKFYQTVVSEELVSFTK